MNRQFTLPLLLAATLLPALLAGSETKTTPALRKTENLVVYQNDKFYSAFPSIVRRRDGELLVAFRRAPNRKLLGEKSNSHTDANSYLVMVRSRDNGRTWSQEPQLIYAHPFGGSQDPCMVQLKDGTLVCTSSGWAQLNPDHVARLTNSPKHGNFVFLGGYVLRSKDGGDSWQGPFLPPPIADNPDRDIFNQPLPSYNRGAMCEGRDGRLFWVVAANESWKPRQTETHLLISSDQG